MSNPETTRPAINDDAGDKVGMFCDEVYEDDDIYDCPQCGGTGVDDTQCACGDDTCCCLEPTPLECSWCGGEG